MIRLLNAIAASPTLPRFAREGAGLVFVHGTGNSYLRIRRGRSRLPPLREARGPGGLGPRIGEG